MLEIVRWSTFLATFLVAGLGYSDQLRLIFENKSTQGLSFLMVLLAFWSWFSYALYGLLRNDHKIFWSNLFGLLLISVILASFWIF